MKHLLNRPRHAHFPNTRRISRIAKPSRQRLNPLGCEWLEERLMLSFFSQIGGCEPVGENGRLIMQAAAIRTSNLSPAGERLPQVYQDAVVSATRATFGDEVGDSMQATLEH